MSIIDTLYRCALKSMLFITLTSYNPDLPISCLHGTLHWPQMPFKLAQEFVITCPVCVKTRIKAANAIPPMYRTIKTRSKATDIDDTLITPAVSGFNDSIHRCAAFILVFTYTAHVITRLTSQE